MELLNGLRKTHWPFKCIRRSTLSGWHHIWNYNHVKTRGIIAARHIYVMQLTHVTCELLLVYSSKLTGYVINDKVMLPCS
jgi:hypothetical protein